LTYVSEYPTFIYIKQQGFTDPMLLFNKFMKKQPWKFNWSKETVERGDEKILNNSITIIR